MAIALSDLVTQLSGLVPAVDGTPTNTQYQDAIKSAVRAFSDKAGMKRLHELPVVSGTATYTLPDDFIKEINLEGAFETAVKYPGVAITGNGIVPLSGDSRLTEEALYNGLTLTIIPTPAYTSTRYLWYKAGHVLDESNEYPYMTEHIADIIMVKAQGNAWRVVADRVIKQGWKYSFGDVTIDKSAVGKQQGEWMGKFDTEFDKRVAAYVGTQLRFG